jgi:hypothetical protein
MIRFFWLLMFAMRVRAPKLSGEPGQGSSVAAADPTVPARAAGWATMEIP